MYDLIIVGAGFAGAVSAQRAANKNKKVLIIDSRSNSGGNAYDYHQDNIIIHRYGPHIFHTSDEEVVNYLNRFTDFNEYDHKVLGHVQGKLIPIPFNYESIEECFQHDMADRLKRALNAEYGRGNKVAILDLRKSKNTEVIKLADFVYENVFKYYTMKQWGLSAEQIDPAVTARVPVRLSYKDSYFDDKYTLMPKNGYNIIFKHLLDHHNITFKTNTNAKEIIKLENNKIYFAGEEFKGQLVYTGAIDELFDYQLGELPYRSLDFELKKVAGTFQKTATENYPGKAELFPYTRITEYKHFYRENEPDDYSYIHIEYPLAYDRHSAKANIPYYPVFTKASQDLYNQYKELASDYPNLILLGRLAEYKYYNMDAIIRKALDVSEIF